MKKSLILSLTAISATLTAILISGNGYLFKAFAINFKKGPYAPSTDDAEKFPSHPVDNDQPGIWKKASDYNTFRFSDRLSKELKKTRASSFIVIHNNQLVCEKYWKNQTSSSLTNSFSMAKGILSLLVGFAIDDGYLRSENDLVSDFIPQYKKDKYGKFLTFRHLMTMQAGMQWEEEYHHPFAENSRQYFVGDLEEQALSIKTKEMPGKKYEYQSVSAQILGIALKKAIGNNLSEYLSKKLWKPLGMEYQAKWSVDEKGLEKAFCCLHAAPLDFAKIGQFVMQKGNWNGKQLISKEFCERFLTPTQENDAFCYSVWADEETTLKYRFFYGFLGQFIIIVPDKQLIIVKTGFYNRLEVDKKMRPKQVSILIEETLEALST